MLSPPPLIGQADAKGWSTNLADKILYFVPDYKPVENAASIRAFYHVEALKREGFSVTVFTSKVNPAAPAAKGNDRYVVRRSQSPSGMLRLKRRLLAEVKLALHFVLYLGRQRNAYQLVVISSPPFFSAVIASMFSTFLKLPYTIDVRDRYPQVLFSQELLPKRSLLSSFLKWLECWIYNRSACVSSVTPPLARQIQSDCGVNEVGVCLNGFDRDVSSSQSPVDGERTKVRIVSHGTFGRFFDESVFDQILSGLDERIPGQYEMILMGSGEKIRRYEGVRFIIIKNADREMVKKVLGESDIGLSCHTDDDSMRAAFPVKIFEFIGASMPSVVIPRSYGGREVERLGIGKCFDQKAVEEACDFISELVRDGKFRREVSGRVESLKHMFSREQGSRAFAKAVARAQK